MMELSSVVLVVIGSLCCLVGRRMDRSRVKQEHERAGVFLVAGLGLYLAGLAVLVAAWLS